MGNRLVTVQWGECIDVVRCVGLLGVLGEPGLIIHCFLSSWRKGIPFPVPETLRTASTLEGEPLLCTGLTRIRLSWAFSIDRWRTETLLSQ